MYIDGLIRLDGKCEGKDAYLEHIPAIAGLDTLKLHQPVTFLAGENGSGKSTLLEAIAVQCGFNAEGGSKNFHFSSRASHSRLHEWIRLQRGTKQPKDGFFLRAESFYNVATEIEALDIMDYYGGTSLHHQSHGESFLTLLLERFGGRGLYLLDEPEAALSPMRQLVMLRRIHDLVQMESQLIIATHSPILLAYPQAEILLLGDGPIRTVSYEETEHYQVTRCFLENPDRMLKVLLQ